MELNISQIHSLNLVTIDGAQIQNVSNYSIKGGRDGKMEVTLTFTLDEVDMVEFTLLKTQ